MASFNHLILVVVTSFLVSAVAAHHEAYENSGTPVSSPQFYFKVPLGVVDETSVFLNEKTTTVMDDIKQFITNNIEAHYFDDNMKSAETMGCLTGCMESYEEARESLKIFQDEISAGQWLIAKENIQNFSGVTESCTKCVFESDALQNVIGNEVEKFDTTLMSVANECSSKIEELVVVV